MREGGYAHTVRLATGLIAAVAIGAPILWMVISSVRPSADILGHLDPLTIESIVPKSVSFHSYEALVRLGFPANLVNSIVATFLTVLIGLAVTVPAAFALAVLRFPGANAIFALLVVGFILPFDILSFPLAQMISRLGLANTVVALVFPLACNGFAIFLLRQFFMAIPRSLYEAARVDGATELRTLISIYLPISKPALVATGILFFVSQWNAYVWPLLVAPKKDAQTAAVTLGVVLQDVYVFEVGQVLAASTILVLLPACAMLLMQRYFVNSLATSGINQ